MKKVTIILVLTLCISFNMVQAQWTTAVNDIYNSNTGNVGIGTTTPGAKLVVNGKSRILSQLSIGANEDGPAWAQLFIKAGGPTIGIIDVTQSLDQKVWLLINQGGKFRILTEKDDYSAAQEAFVITRSGMNITTAYFPNGNVGIGTNNPGTFKLAVEGKIGARSVKITQATPFPDYVFDPGYNLLSLKETEAYINKVGHLPGIPSADEVKKEGYDVSEMDAALLKKIEELTLHVIELNKKMDKLVNENKKLKRADANKRSHSNL